MSEFPEYNNNEIQQYIVKHEAPYKEIEEFILNILIKFKNCKVSNEKCHVSEYIINNINLYL